MRVLLRYRGGRYESRDRLSPADVSLIRDGAQAEEGTLELPLAELYEKNKKKKGLSTMTLQELLAAGPQSEPNRESGKGKKKPEVESPIVELSKRVSFAVTPIVFALIGIPLAIGAQRRETSIGFVISLGVGMLYYLLLILADSTRGKPQLHPEWLVWLPNLLFFIGGLVLFTRLERR
jgi:lipopolysaccharide export system permease protein